MLQRLGDVIYWTASGAAVLCVFIGVLIAVTDHLHPSPSDWIAPIVACLYSRALSGSPVKPPGTCSPNRRSYEFRKLRTLLCGIAILMPS